MVVRPAVALHVAFPGRGFVGAYPASLMGGIAFVRQAFADAQHYQQASALAESAREPYDAALAAMGPALNGTLPVAFRASTPREIRRALAFAKEFSVAPIIVGGQGAEEVAQELKAAGARVVVSVNYPTQSQGAGAGCRRVARGVAGPRRGAARRRGAVCCRSAVWLRVCRFEGP